MNHESTPVVVSRHHVLSGSFKHYLIGFLTSLYLTVLAYVLTIRHNLSQGWLEVAVISFALLQFALQLLFFLHVGVEAKPRWKLVVFWLMISVVCILVFGSLWIMTNLNYHMTPSQIHTYLQSQDGL